MQKVFNQNTFIMKKVIILIFLCPLLAILGGCEKQEQTLQIEEPVLEINAPDLTVNISGKGGISSFAYSIKNPAGDGEIIAESVSEWIVSIDYSTTPGIVVFEAAPNGTDAQRTCEIAVIYTYGEGQEVEERVKVVQSAAETDAEYDYEFEAQVFNGIYYGMRHGKNREHSYYTRLSNLPELSQAGSISYEFEMFTEAPEDDFYPVPAIGTYFLGNDGETELMTFSGAAYTQVDGNGNIIKSLSFVSGTVDLIKEGETYSYEIILTDEEGLTHHVSYKSDVSVVFEDQSQTSMTLEKDLNIKPITVEASFKELSGEKAMHVKLYMSEDDWLDKYSELHIEAYMPFDANGNIAEGTYDITANYSDAFTMQDGEIMTFAGVQYPVGSYVQYVYNGAYVAWGVFKSGTMTVSGSNGNYNIECNFVTAENFYVTCIWSGEIEIQDMPATTFSDDVEVDLSGARGEATFYGDVSDDGSEWMIELIDEAGGQRVRIELNSGDTEFSDGITSGEYTASPSSSPWKGEFRKGSMSEEGIAGTFYISGIGADGNPSDYAAFVGGSITVDNHGDGTYVISFALKDGLENTISGSWSGTLECTDTTLPATSTLTGDRNLDLSMTGSAKAYFEGTNEDGNGNWVVQLRPTTLQATDGIQIDIVCSSTSFSDGVPAGNFTVAENGSPVAGELNPGQIIDGGLYGTMFLGYDIVTGSLSEYAAAKSGSAEITANGDGSYSIDFSFVDEYGHEFTGNWSGMLTTVDYSE